VQSLNVAALTGDPAQESDLTGTFSGSVVGTDPQTMALDLSASLQGARYGTYQADALDLTTTLRRGLLNLDLDADLGAAGRVAATGTARPFLQTPTYRVTADLQNVDLSQLQDGGASTDLTGTLVLDGSGFDPQTLSADGQITLAPSRYADQQIDGADLALALSGGDLSVTGDVDVPGGGFALNLGGRPFDEDPSVVLGPGTRFRNVNLGALLGNDPLTTSLNGTAEGTLRGVGGFDPQTLTADLDVVLAESTVNDALIGGGVAGVTLADGWLDLDSRLELGRDENAGRVTLDVGGRLFDEVPTYDLDARFSRLDLGAFAGAEADRGASLTGAVRLDGSGLTLETADLIGAVALGDGRLGTATLDTLGAQIALADGLLRVEGVTLQSEIATASGGGQIALTDAATDARTDFELTADVVSLEPLTPFLATPVAVERGDLRARVQGRPGRPLSIDLDLNVQQLVYGELGASGLDLRVLGQYDPRAPESADSTAAVQVAGMPRGLTLRTRLEFDYFDTGTTLAPLQRGDLDLVIADELTLDGDVIVDNKRDLDLRLRLDPDPEARRVAVERMAIVLDGTRWQLLQEASIRYDDGYTIRDLLLYSEGADGEPEQQIAIDGTLDPEGTQNLILTIEDVSMGQFTDLVGYGDLGGTLSASLLMTGRADRPEIDGTLVVDDFSTRGETVGSLDIGVTYGGEQLELDALLTHVDGERLSAAGFLPLQFQLGPGPEAPVADSAAVASVGGASDGSAEAALVILADAFPIAWAEPLVPPYLVTELGGTLAADVVLGGTQGAPSLSGTMQLSEGRIGLPTTGRTFSNISLPLVFDGNRVLVQNARMDDGGGEYLAVDGTILLPELSLGELDLTITANEYVVMETETYDELRLSTGSRPLRFTGTTEMPRLEGAIELASGDIYNTAELTGATFEDVTLDEQEVQRIEAMFGLRATAADTSASEFYQNLEMDLAIEIDRDVWFRSRSQTSVDVEFAGSIQAQKAAQSEELLLFNQIEVVRGNVEFSNRRFDITRGRLTFNGPVDATYVDLLAELEIRGLQDNTSPEVTIQLAFTGSLAEEPKLTLSSDPQMDNADIVSYIATGRPAAELFDTGAGGDVAGQFALSQIAGLVENLAGAGLGLDVVQIETRPDGSIVVVAGKYISERAYASVGQQVKAPDQRSADEADGRFPEIALEYELLEWLQLRLQRRNEGVGAGLLYELAW
jgi:translocation and assembly module TamB